MKKSNLLKLVEILEKIENKSFVEILLNKINKYKNFEKLEEFIFQNEIFENKNSKTIKLENSKFYFYNNQVKIETNKTDIENNKVVKYIQDLLTKKHKLYVLSKNKNWVLLPHINPKVWEKIIEVSSEKIILRIIRTNKTYIENHFID